jgi:hypothetical protein
MDEHVAPEAFATVKPDGNVTLIFPSDGIEFAEEK